MHWFVLIALWAFMSFSLLGSVKGKYVNLDIIERIIWISGVLFFAIGFYIGDRKQKQKKHEQSILEKNKNKEKQDLLDKYYLPIDCPTYQYVSGHPGILGKQDLNLWIGQGSLNMLLTSKGILKHQISIGDINYFSVKGDLKQETEVDDNGLSAIGTMVAEEMFGTAAAMRANQKVPKIVNVDERKTVINATIDGENKFILFEKADAYNYLLENIPEKEISFVMDK